MRLYRQIKAIFWKYEANSIRSLARLFRCANSLRETVCEPEPAGDEK